LDTLAAYERAAAGPVQPPGHASSDEEDVFGVGLGLDEA
jgi:hypothetical protein